MSFSVIRTVFVALLLDIFAFTVILPLLPRLLDEYHLQEGHDPTTLLGSMLKTLHEYRHMFDGNKYSDGITRGGRSLDIVLLGGAMGSLFSLLQFASAPIMGKLSDMYGRRIILLFAMIGNIVSCGLWIVAKDFKTFLLSRIIGGIFEGNVQLSIAIIADVTHHATRSRAMALVGIAFAIGFTIGPATGAYFASMDMRQWKAYEHFSWVHPYSATALFAFVLLVIEFIFLYLYLPETKNWHKEEVSQASSETAKPLLSSDTARPDGTLAKSRTSTLTWMHLVYLFLFSGMEYTLTFLTFDVHQFTHADQGKLLGFIGILSALIQGGYMRSKRRKASDSSLAVFGMGACAVGLVAVAWSCIIQGRLWLYIGAIGFAIASAMVVNSLNTIASVLSDEIRRSTGIDERGEVLGRFRSRGQLGRACGPLIWCGVYWWIGPVWTYLIGMASLGLLAGTCWWIMAGWPYLRLVDKKKE